MLRFLKKFRPQYAYSRYAYKEKKVYIDLRNIDLLDTHLGLLHTDIPGKHFVCLQDIFKACLQEVFKTYVFSVTFFPLPRHLEILFMKVNSVFCMYISSLIYKSVNLC